MPSRSRRENWYARAALVLRSEDPVPITDLTGLCMATPEAILRWITRGKRGVRLEGYESPIRGWVSSAAAVERFRVKLASPKQSSDSSHVPVIPTGHQQTPSTLFDRLDASPPCRSDVV